MTSYPLSTQERSDFAARLAVRILPAHRPAEGARELRPPCCVARAGAAIARRGPRRPSEKLPGGDAAWRDALDRIAGLGVRRVVVLGAADVGKTTFCSALARRLLASGQGAALLDTDPGQKMVGPPATVSLGRWAAPDRPPQLAAMCFVRDTSPYGNFLPWLAGVARIVATPAPEPLIVNTMGMVTGVGRSLAAHLIEIVRPNLLVAIERGDELARILAEQRHLPTLRLAPSPAARRKTNAERAAVRRAAFAAYFAAAAPVELAMDALVFQYVAEDEPGPQDRNRLCGIGDAAGECRGLAIIEEVDREGGRLRLVTPVPPQHVRIVQLGTLLVTRDGEERGRVARRRG
jgi:polynucleotide 5'-hydroxyl-kinase GRC3/NOL9